MPLQWLHLISIVSLALGAVCFSLIVRDELRDPQHMWIMNVVWPVVALFGSFAVLWAYRVYGKLTTHAAMARAHEAGREPPSRKRTPFAMMVAKGTSHCGSGCAIGDIIAEWLAFVFPAIALWFGWKTIFSEKVFAVWVLDYILAFGIGVAFQYFTIKPMRDLSVRQGLVQAVKADFLSLTAWQVGMYGFMALSFWIFRNALGTKLEVDTFEFWFMMQIAMWCGFATSYPVNWLLIRSGIKEKM